MSSIGDLRIRKTPLPRGSGLIESGLLDKTYPPSMIDRDEGLPHQYYRPEKKEVSENVNDLGMESNRQQRQRERQPMEAAKSRIAPL